MKALDLFCCQGGATRGLQLAGYHVTGVDIAPQPRYCGDRFVQGDALTVALDGYDLIWASPPCQTYSELTPLAYRASHADLIAPIRDRLIRQGTPAIIENVFNAVPSLRSPVMLCGTMFGLNVWRHRFFEFVNCDPFFLVPPCCHSEPPIIVSGRGMRKVNGKRRKDNTSKERQDAMRIDWMDSQGIMQAIPPAYSQFLAEQLRK